MLLLSLASLWLLLLLHDGVRGLPDRRKEQRLELLLLPCCCCDVRGCRRRRLQASIERCEVGDGVLLGQLLRGGIRMRRGQLRLLLSEEGVRGSGVLLMLLLLHHIGTARRGCCLLLG